MSNRVSGRVATTPSEAGAQKLGHPVPESNLVPEPNRSAPQQMQRYMPGVLQSLYSPEKRFSVPLSRATRNCSSVNRSCHSGSDF